MLRNPATPRRRPALLALAGSLWLGLTLSGAGCASKATEEACDKACANLVTVSLGEIDQKMESHEDLKDSGKEGKEMARTMAATMVDVIRSECFKECKEKATADKAECLTAAKTVADLERCQR